MTPLKKIWLITALRWLGAGYWRAVLGDGGKGDFIRIQILFVWLLTSFAWLLGFA